jgi:hypothetical protein
LSTNDLTPFPRPVPDTRHDGKGRGRPDQAWSEGAGFVASPAFTLLGSARDVYFGGVFQSISPLVVVIR